VKNLLGYEPAVGLLGIHILTRLIVRIGADSEPIRESIVVSLPLHLIKKDEVKWIATLGCKSIALSQPYFTNGKRIGRFITEQML
jgi:hypothetical protein